MGTGEAVGALIGRELELESVVDGIDAIASGARAVVIEGEAGIGKTVLWRRALDIGRANGLRVLACAPAGSEVRLSFSALGDLFDPVIEESLATLPGPQRRALEIALLRRVGEQTTGALDRRAIGVGTLAALRALVKRGPLVVSIDDLQWLDAPSAAALQFALRRLRDEPILVLATRRLEREGSPQPELERTLRDDRVVRLRLSPLSVGALHELLLTRLGFDASRPTLVRLHETTGGNPFFALEIARELRARGIEPRPDEPLPVPGTIRELVRTRMARLSPTTRTFVLAAAALTRPTVPLLERFAAGVGPALADASSAAVIEQIGDRVSFTHPLLASVLYEDATLGERRALHARLAELLDDVEERARHLALATDRSDAGVARALDQAAGAAAGRGAPQAAAELCDLAARLSAEEAERWERVLAAAEFHHRAGALALAAHRAQEVLAGAKAPATRVRALAVLGTVRGDTDGTEAAVELYFRALREPGAPRALRADLHHKLTWVRLVGADAYRAERHAEAARRLSAGVDPASEAAAAAVAGLVAAVRGRPESRALLARARALVDGAPGEQPWAWAETSAAALEGVALLWEGDLEAARVPLERMRQTAAERDDPWHLMHALAYLSPLETGLGNPALGLELARRYLELAVTFNQDVQRAGALWPLAVAAGWLGRIDEARTAAHEGVSLAQHTGQLLYVIGNLTALGAVELSAGDGAAAASALLSARELADRGGISALGRFPLRAHAVDALCATGDLERAATIADELERLAGALGGPWALALAARCRGMIADARGNADAAHDAFEDALDEHERQDRPLERARTLLAFGSALRRGGAKRAAREMLERAAAAFDSAGAERWAARSRAELGRIGGRRGADASTLSATETAIAELTAVGRTNREVGATLHLSPRTVEWNLSKVYRKLDVRSRTELAVALTKPRDSPG
jgi:DNA-binding CsgD family transcriptional regulator